MTPGAGERIAASLEKLVKIVAWMLRIGSRVYWIKGPGRFSFLKGRVTLDPFKILD